MGQQRRLNVRGFALTGQVQRLFEELRLSGSAEFSPVELVLELDTFAQHPVYIGWCNVEGAKPNTITAANGLPLEAEQIRTLRNDSGSYPRADYRMLCWQGDVADAGRVLTVSWWETTVAVNPI